MVASGIVGKPVRAVGGFFGMALDTFVLMFKPPFAWREFILQAWFVARVSRESPAEQAPPSGPAPPALAAAEYDPASGTYVGPDGHVYTQADLARGATEEQTWQTMLLPPTGN